jgi:sterol desaturase/sphingolipid hydroxylase (fatty acid hydroxylase superfamily)
MQLPIVLFAKAGMDAFLHLLAGAAGRVERTTADTFLSPGSTFSLLSLLSALGVAALSITVIRLRRRGRISPRLLVKALWPRAAVLGASGKADIGFFFFNTFSAGGLIGWALLSQAQVHKWALAGLTAAFGHTTRRVSGFDAALINTVAIFLAYDLAYWTDHWLNHRLPFLWEIHKVHHTAEALSPLTNFRVHPIESWTFYNIVSLFTGVAHAAVVYGVGADPGQVSLFGTDVGVLAFMFTIAHLQHTHVWLSFRGWLGRVLLSPAHHQIHHSTDPRHFGSNLGNALAIWDLMFGTLYVPAAEREALTFGVAGAGPEAHGVTGSLITPMVEAFKVLTGRQAPAGTQAPQAS